MLLASTRMTSPPRALHLAILAAPMLALAPAPAQAGETACWFEHGAVVVPASVGGAAGDYILDTGTPRTVMHDTRAQAEGVDAGGFQADVRLAGLAFPARAVGVESLDARAGHFPTPIAGVIGADLLAGQVLDVSFTPCRVGLYPAGEAPELRGGRTVRLTLTQGVPTTRAAVSDGTRGVAGDWVIATGAPLGVRLDDRLAAAKGVTGALYPDGADSGRMRGLSLDGRLVENPSAGLLRAEQAIGAGTIGTQVLSRWRLRLDFARGRLALSP